MSSRCSPFNIFNIKIPSFRLKSLVCGGQNLHLSQIGETERHRYQKMTKYLDVWAESFPHLKVRLTYYSYRAERDIPISTVLDTSKLKVNPTFRIVTPGDVISQSTSF